MNECILCKKTCSRFKSKEITSTCCLCGLIPFDEICSTCYKNLSSELVLESGIHYWYKLKYEFNILKYITSYHSDFNKHDKRLFSQSKHNDEILLSVRNMGTYYMNLTDWRTELTIDKDLEFKDFTSHLKDLLIPYGDMFFYMKKGKISYISKDYMIRSLFNTLVNDMAKYLQQFKQKD